MSAPGETLDQAWTKRLGHAARRPPLPGVLRVFDGVAPRFDPLALEGGTLELGRGRIGDVELEDPCMSRRHATVTLRDEAWVLTDLGSRNGSAVDGVALSGEQRSATARVLRAGDSLFLLCRDLRRFLSQGVQVIDGAVIGPVLREVWDRIDAAAGSSENLHVTGETGAGKELAARRFHRAGPNAGGPFVPVNCATIPAALAERLLFGAKKGTYSGADADVEGYVQAANGGTLFLDEVAELDPQVQAKLLRVIETREVVQLGAQKGRKVRLGVCSATHGALEDRVEEGRFRQDLYFRLGRPTVALPALRDRTEDLPFLLVQLLQGETSLAPHASLVEQILIRPWPGNVRELALEIKEAVRAAVRKRAERLEAEHLDDKAGQGRGSRAAVVTSLEMPAPVVRRTQGPAAPIDRETVAAALAAQSGNISATARALGVHRTQLRRWLERYDLSPGESVEDAGDEVGEQDPDAQG